MFHEEAEAQINHKAHSDGAQFQIKALWLLNSLYYYILLL